MEARQAGHSKIVSGQRGRKPDNTRVRAGLDQARVWSSNELLDNAQVEAWLGPDNAVGIRRGKNQKDSKP